MRHAVASLTVASLAVINRAAARRAAAVATAGVVLLGGVAPAWALCPNCLGQQATVTPTLRLVGLFLLVPPAVFFLVVRAIRRLSR